MCIEYKPVPFDAGRVDIWMQDYEERAAGDCGCVLEISPGTNENPALTMCQLHKAAPGLLAALKLLAGEINLSKLRVRRDFSLMNAHACALKAIHEAEVRS